MSARTGIRLWLVLALAASALADRAASAALPRPGLNAQNQCLTCHRKETERRLVEPTLHIADDVHTQAGFGCVGCHGGDPNDADITGMDPDKGFRGKPSRAEIAELCAGCHSNAEYMKLFDPQPYIFSLAEFRTSVHCKKIAEGDLKVATCTNCHGVHGIRSYKDPQSPVYARNVPRTCSRCHNPDYMKGRKVATNQFTLYQTSVHGRALLEKGDLSAPACNDCHGNHGAVPPNTRDISRVCSNCHGREGELFEASKVKESLELEGKRGCVTCHGNHGVQIPTDAMVGLSGEGVCGSCHASNSAGAAAAAGIVPRFHALRQRIATADSLLGHAERLGMPTTKGREALKQADDHLMNTRVTLHSFDGKLILAAIGEGMTSAGEAQAQAEKALKDWRDRRVGMSVSLVVIVLVIGLLVARIRSTPPRSGEEPMGA